MGDTRFTTVAEDVTELLDAMDVDDVSDIETLLIVLFAMPIGVECVTGDEEADAGILDVTVWTGDLGFGSRYAFPMSAMDLVRMCASVVDEVGTSDGDDGAEDSDRSDIVGMYDDELITTLQAALGQVRIYNMLVAEE